MVYLVFGLTLMSLKIYFHNKSVEEKLKLEKIKEKSS